ncbi:DNA gyrase inhibitor YacG [Xinfangfangia sp. CPCC 101601]|uniref:DNA gyrase inhibitor YacG n=1 Tax=Pseudogemmobacter lacusdianii TaxID=3069608 RepID=A0ABU0VZQ0_9RHOB|nr:DNA gyrase inhibitor YacG [Xinfangfangia sp. CPCC 101601]MDQ2067241.1 DNA gyrase inhibitor YacG [Xinfangfangia sp. CPCC 101601]
MSAGCPICGKETVHAYRPFCSRRCADIDLGRWLNESYRVPDDAAGEDDISSDALPLEIRPEGKKPH